MEALIASFLESLASGGGGAGGMMAESALGGAPTIAPTVIQDPSLSESLVDATKNIGNEYMAPTLEAYKTFTSPSSTVGDMVSAAYKYQFNPKTREDEQMMSAPQMRMGGGGMANNYVGGIPSLLQGYGGASQGILPYIAGR
jgi:hypothetical protein